MKRKPYRYPRGWARIRLAVLNRDGWVCQICGRQLSRDHNSPAGAQVDHKVPLVAGGTNQADNLQAACRTCNTSRGQAEGIRHARRAEVVSYL